ncbi:ent-copalyl diphosphate synthase 1-like [Aristolochia californica]|uniref:ent-copalyl diphosphate synthase 1-like n=1 Tax=Aristolochia californica TaxID=171875 RepID=UPI0035DFB220
MTSPAIFLRPSPITVAVRNPPIRLPLFDQPELFCGFRIPGRGFRQGNAGSSRCHAITEVCASEGVLRLPVIERPELVEKVNEEKAVGKVRFVACHLVFSLNRAKDFVAIDRLGTIRMKVQEQNDIEKRIELVKNMLNSMGDGEISVSAYDTAWVALVEDVSGSGAPQFPSSLEWIVENQLSDGSWGDQRIFIAYDRIINTLACVIALRSWNLCPHGCEKGMSFLRENMVKLEDDKMEHMPIGFEVAFPSLIEIARSLDLDVPFDAPVLQEIYPKREVKLGRIPMEMLHKVPTTLLHSLEGMPNLDWQKLLKLQSQDGSFLFSPSSTAFALKQARDPKCLSYIQRMVERFKGGVPSVYPVDLFEHIWAVDRLERLGISRHFEKEVTDCLDYTYRYWTEDGISWARNSRVQDVDDTAMGFRLLRLHGYEVYADAFRNFKKGGEFVCFAGQSNQAVTGLFNLYRASQVSFPGEKILEDARTFSYKFLREKQASGQLVDKWIIAKDLPGEVGYALDFPWYASLPRIETRYYLDHYGGENDVWIGKTLYRMPYVNNNLYLELARMDFNKCQELHQLEWREIQNWYDECNLEELGVSKRTALEAYFVAAASIFEPERASERLAWARTALLAEAVSSYLKDGIATGQALVRDFANGTTSWSGSKKTGKGLVGALLQTLRQLSWEALLAHGTDVRLQLKQAWEEWLKATDMRGEDYRRGESELIVRTINLCAGRSTYPEQVLSHPLYGRLARLTDSVCHYILRMRETKAQGLSLGTEATSRLADESMDNQIQEIVEVVLQSSKGLDRDIKQAFLTVAKSFYYSVRCPSDVLNLHIAKVLFERV